MNSFLSLGLFLIIASVLMLSNDPSLIGGIIGTFALSVGCGLLGAGITQIVESLRDGK